MAQVTGFPTRLKAPPRTDDINVLREYIAELANYYALLAKEIDFVVNGNIDAKNVRAKGIEAENISVDELSSISANLGTINAGTIYGAYIATANGTFPRCEMSSTGNLFTAYKSATEYVSFNPDLSGAAAPGLEFKSPTQTARITIEEELLYINSSGPIHLVSNDDYVVLGGILGQGAVVYNWSRLANVATETTLQEELDILSDRITALGG